MTRCVRRRSSGAALTLASAPAGFELRKSDELGENLLSCRRLHELRHGNTSILLDQGVDITVVSKRLGHGSTTITGTLYTGQRAAQTMAAAVPRQ
ncbi:tyrosine-type recombinase/integrase [Frankia sp. R82]|uniref:tyrosine-type recombinase/integrase n=1 Tax=Frankia sp. R82 TaxID=2950553 RepID=UPI002043237A|nr:tyrosine-type recombinase/integrase [Frankia sp. R82]MCM3886027.1 tyrosine-type recombinase/integrase [Frankia sp. R82]